MENLSGGFTSFREISSEEKALFAKALDNFVGVGYTPLAVATQVVNGMNYAFFCNSRIAVPGVESYNSLVIIYKPISGEPILKEIKKVNILAM